MLRHRLLRFSLRGILLIVSDFAIWLGIAVHQIRTRHAAVNQSQPAGGAKTEVIDRLP
jgi:hypothetical protein